MRWPDHTHGVAKRFLAVVAGLARTLVMPSRSRWQKNRLQPSPRELLPVDHPARQPAPLLAATLARLRWLASARTKPPACKYSPALRRPAHSRGRVEWPAR